MTYTEWVWRLAETVVPIIIILVTCVITYERRRFKLKFPDKFKEARELNQTINELISTHGNEVDLRDCQNKLINIESDYKSTNFGIISYLSIACLLILLVFIAQPLNTANGIYGSSHTYKVANLSRNGDKFKQSSIDFDFINIPEASQLLTSTVTSDPSVTYDEIIVSVKLKQITFSDVVSYNLNSDVHLIEDISAVYNKNTVQYTFTGFIKPEIQDEVEGYRLGDKVFKGEDEKGLMSSLSKTKEYKIDIIYDNSTNSKHARYRIINVTELGGISNVTQQ